MTLGIVKFDSDLRCKMIFKKDSYCSRLFSISNVPFCCPGWSSQSCNIKLVSSKLLYVLRAGNKKKID